MEKQKVVDKNIYKLKQIAADEIKKNRYDVAMAAISSCAEILYKYNQYYFDADLEYFVGCIANLYKNDKASYIEKKGVVLFYDGFGLDLRGWAASYVKALVALQYKVIYVTRQESKNCIPHILKELKDNIAEFIPMGSYKAHVDALRDVFNKYKPGTAFFYTKPYDVAGAVVFRGYEGLVNRIQIDLTDHAFWIGKDSVDICQNSREYGASIAVNERNFNNKQVVKLDCVPYVNRDKYTEPLPFDIYSNRYVFSGGALYKTLGDGKCLYYETIRQILEFDADIKFLYAGSGDSTELKKIQLEYIDRVFLINERPDYFRLIENSVFFLNTYPVFGGLMMRYSALAHKLPLTLKHDRDADNVLLNQDTIGIEFNIYSDFISEIKRVLSDDSYRERKERIVSESVITEDIFIRNLEMIIDEGVSEFKFASLEPIDTTEFRKKYLERFDLFKDMENLIANKQNIGLIKYFPMYFIKKMIKGRKNI